MTGARVVGVGHAGAGDDAVGLAVVRALRAAPPPGASVLEVGEPSRLVEALSSPGRVVVVDAVVGPGALGEVVELDPDDLGRGDAAPLSTHGIDVLGAVALARALEPDAASRDVLVVGVRIAPVAGPGLGLSLAVAAAVPRAVAAVRAACAAGPGPRVRRPRA